MFGKVLIIFILMVSLPIFLFAERPYIGFEEGLFFPRGEWKNGIDMKEFPKLFIQQKVIKNYSAGLTASSVTFSGTNPEDFKLSMSPLIYLDAIAEAGIKKEPNIGAGLLLGSVYSAQEINYGSGSEKATIWGWSAGCFVYIQHSFVKRAYLKARTLSLAATGGYEFSLGVIF